MRQVTILAGLLALAPAARAQQADSVALRQRVAALRPHTLLRFELIGGRRVTAPLLAPTDAGITLGDAAGIVATVPYGDAARLWQRRRSTRTGAIVVGLVGAGAGAFLGAVGHALCESNNCGSAGGAVAGGALLVGALGAGIGAIIGAAIPHWQLTWSRRAGAPAPPTAAAPGAPSAPATREQDITMTRGARHIGEASLLGVAGYGGFPSAPLSPGHQGGLAGIELGLALRAGPIAFGPEAALMKGTQTVWTLGGMLRLDLAARSASARPYLLGGIGATNWGSRNYDAHLLTLTLGAGTTFARAHWRIEGRWHPCVQNAVDPKPVLFTLAAGRRIGF